jgi:hypothetical protein
MRSRKAPASTKPTLSDRFMTTETNPSPETSTEIANAAPAAGKSPAAPRLRLDDSAMKSSYANFANVTSTREETILMFGMLQAYNRGQNEIPVQVTDRIVMSPFVARRLSKMLSNVLQNYEARFGPLGDEAQ